MPLKLPALDPADVPDKRSSLYPEPFRSRMGERSKRRLGDACGLTKFGVNLVTLLDLNYRKRLADEALQCLKWGLKIV